VLNVTDDGHGMDEHVVERIFEPFFTTRGPTRTGLGLSTVYGIVSDAGGWVSVESRPGGGASLEVWLPVADDTWAPAP